MGGCDWQKETFSVGLMTQKTLSVCDECSLPIDNTVYHYNGSTLCRECFTKRPSLRQRLGIEEEFGFNTSKDKLYEFVDNKNFRYPVEVHGKRHWKKLLKQHGLVDDVDLKKIRRENIKQGSTDKSKLIDRRFISDEMRRELQERGLNGKLFKRKGR